MGLSFEAVTADILTHPLFEETRQFVHHGVEIRFTSTRLRLRVWRSAWRVRWTGARRHHFGHTCGAAA